MIGMRQISMIAYVLSHSTDYDSIISPFRSLYIDIAPDPIN